MGEKISSPLLLSERKKRVKILLLGPYRPKRVLKRLENLRDCLVRRGFSSTKLVKDFPDRRCLHKDDDVHFTRKSRWCMRSWAHVLVFVFFSEGANLGVGNELSYLCLKLGGITSHSVVLIEKGLNVGSQIRGTVKIDSKLSYEVFIGDNELCDLAFGHCTKTLHNLFYFLD